jgi:hypothetical protein
MKAAPVVTVIAHHRKEGSIAGPVEWTMERSKRKQGDYFSAEEPLAHRRQQSLTLR